MSLSSARISSSPCRTPAGRGCHLVIADGGTFACLVTFAPAHRPEVGNRFSFLGRQWQVRSYRRHTRAFVATPAVD